MPSKSAQVKAVTVLGKVRQLEFIRYSRRTAMPRYTGGSWKSHDSSTNPSHQSIYNLPPDLAVPGSLAT